MRKRRHKISSKAGTRRRRTAYGVLLTLGILLLWFLVSLGSLRSLLGPSLTGFPGSNRDYLVIFQNNYELRPTGGFISAYGIIKFRHGIFAGLEVNDVFGKIDDHEYVEPPAAMKELLAHRFYQGHTFRDANWNPDFPQTAAELEKFLHINFPDQDVDGVIAMDFHVLEDLIEVFGKLKADGSIFTRDSAFELIEHHVSNIDRHSVEEIANRKSILKVIAKKLIWKAIFRPWKVNNIADTLAQNLDEGHALLYFKDPTLQQKADRKSWAGTFPYSGTGAFEGTDYIALVEANLGGMKSNRYITRDIEYAVDLEEKEATLKIIYTHHGELNVPLSSDYKGFLRTYVPGNTFEKTLTIPVGGSETIQYVYSIETAVQEKNYTIRLDKQPGTFNDRYRVVVRAPLGMVIRSKNFETRENYGFAEGNLTEDITLNLELLEDIIPPRPAFHEITALNTVELHFNEDIASSGVEDLLNFSITDLNKNDPRTDTITVKNIRHNGRFLTFETEGMTIQQEEFYSLEIKNIRDKSGNFLEPSPRTLTLVQRLN